MSSGFTTRAPVIGRRGAIATSNYLATEAGMRTLRQGGSCVDAALAAAAVLNVVEPHCSHPGGDAFMLVWDAREQTVTAINSSGVAPRGMHGGLFHGEVPASGFLSSTVPGQVAAWEEAHGRYGRLTREQVLAEAIYYAEEGFPVSRELAGALEASYSRLARFPSSMKALMPQGRPPARAELLRQPDLAHTLRTLAQEGFRAFYDGEIAQRIASFWQANGGVLTAEDLAAHQAHVLEPLSTTYRGHEVYEQPPVSQGHILLQSLNIVENWDLAALGHLSAEALHVCIEANKLAHADKDCYTTDPAWSPFPVGLLCKEYAAERARLVNMEQAMDFPPPPGNPPAAQETTYLCCVDGEGNAVSYIQSLFHAFGCGVVAEGTGVLLNNRATGFSLEPAHANFLQPGKKTVHTLNTYMVFREGRLTIVGGTPGGDVQVQTNLQVLTGLLDFGRDAQQAVEDARWVRGMGRDVNLETRAPRQAFEGLTARGHRVHTLGPYSQGGRAQVICTSPEGALIAGSDPRCDGCALAF